MKKKIIRESEIEIDHTIRVNFYKAANLVWSELTNPTLDEIQLAMLEIVAKSINYNLKLEKDTFGKALYDILLVLINRNHEIITEDNFIRLIKNYLGISWKEELDYYHACSEYYEFVKHFILIDFPNRQHNLLKRFNVALQSKICYFNDNMITLIEEVWKDFFERFLKGQFQFKKQRKTSTPLLIERFEENPILLDENAKKEILNHQLTHILISNSNYNRFIAISKNVKDVVEEIGENFFIGLNQVIMETKLVKEINIKAKLFAKFIKAKKQWVWVRINLINEKLLIILDEGTSCLKKLVWIDNLSTLEREIEKIFQGIKNEQEKVKNKSIELYKKVVKSYQNESAKA
jgi:hypothetical protein